jgi:pSer/pThr/pTyr-binding forkhead associated (FHA) protein
MEVQMQIVQGKQRGQVLRFRRGEFVFGRGPECHIRPNSDWVSRQHCLLRVGANGASICDLGSTNGTLVNGTRVLDERPLTPGDKLQLGPLVLQVEFSRSEAERDTREVQGLATGTLVEDDVYRAGDDMGSTRVEAPLEVP